MFQIIEYVLSMVARLVGLLFDEAAFTTVLEIPVGYYLIGFFVLWLGFNVFVITVTNLGNISSMLGTAAKSVKALGRGNGNGNNT